MRARSSPAVALVVVGLAAGGCGDEGGRSGAADTGPSGSGTRAPTVDMRDIRFVPEDVVVQRGGTITWKNSDALSHTVTKASGPGPRFDSGTVPAGRSYRRRFTEAGLIRYVCTIHPNQRGTVTVR